MKIKWERNSRALALARAGKIKDEDIIARTTTDNFPAEMATVRMAKLSEKVPSVTVHIRGKGKQRSNWNNTYTWNAAATLRVNMYPNYPTCPNGELDEDLTWLDVHNVVEEVKGVMA